MKTESPQKALELIVQRLQAGLHPEQIILFGSHAYGDPTEGSDIDLLIIVSDSSDPPHHRAQRAYRCVGAVGIPKDMVVLTREEFEKQLPVVTSLARLAREKGKVVYDRGEKRGNTKMADQKSA